MQVVIKFNSEIKNLVRSKLESKEIEIHSDLFNDNPHCRVVVSNELSQVKGLVIITKNYLKMMKLEYPISFKFTEQEDYVYLTMDVDLTSIKAPKLVENCSIDLFRFDKEFDLDVLKDLSKNSVKIDRLEFDLDGEIIELTTP